jgi:glycine/D-amino acid oxidase-like deaminating enzyme
LGNERSWFLRYSKSFDYMTQNPKTGYFFLGGGVLQGDAHGVSDVGNPNDREHNFLSRCHLTGVLPRLFTAGSSDDGHSILKSSWTGTMGYSCDGRPWVGRLPSRISGRSVKVKYGTRECGEWIAAGFCGSGMVYCWMSGQALAAMMGGKTPGWFPEALLPTEKRFQSCDVSDLAGFFFEMMA